MRFRKRPECHLRAMEKLQGRRAADAARAGSANPIATVKPIERQFPRVVCSRRRLDETMVMEARDDLEQVLGRLLLMRENEHALAAIAARTVIETAGDIGRTSLLTPLEDERTDFTDTRVLCLKLLMNEPLGAIQHEWRDRTRFGADTQMLCGKDQVVDFRSSAVATDLRGRLNLACDIRCKAGGVRASLTPRRLHPALGFLQQREV